MVPTKDLRVKYVPIADVHPYEDNPRRNDGAVQAVANSLREFGWKQPIVVDADGTIVVGHTRYKAAKALGMDEVPVVVASDLTPEQVNAYRLADNKTAELAEWDAELLAQELDGLADLDMSAFGFDSMPSISDAPSLDGEAPDVEHATLNERFIVPPFSVLDARQGYWRERKEAWIARGIDSGRGRAGELIASSRKTGAYSNVVEYMAPSTSIFDPVLAEVLVRWFCPPGGSVLDPFAGGSVRGIVSEMTGHAYTGIDLRPEQVEANRENALDMGVSPTWICADSMDVLDHVEPESMDMVLSCPPYADLEVYSDDPRDLSTMDYPGFIASYRAIIERTCSCLKSGRLAVFVVGDVRGSDGTYRGFVNDTRDAFEDAGLRLYDDMVYLEPLGNAAVRAPRVFNSMRKVIKTHQNVLVFLKGRESDIKTFGPVIADGDLDGVE